MIPRTALSLDEPKDARMRTPFDSAVNSRRLDLSSGLTSGHVFGQPIIAALAAGAILAGCAGKGAGEGGGSWSSKERSSSGSNATAPGASEIPISTPRDAAGVYARPAPRGGASFAREPGELRHAALEVSRQASGSSQAIIRAHAIEALIAAPTELDGVVGRGLIDVNRGVRFVAAMAIAKAKRTELSHLVEPLTGDASDSVRAAALAALAVCGRHPDLSPLATMVRSNDPEVRANAYLAIGIIGNPSAMGMVRESVGGGFDRTDPARVKLVDLQAAECMVRLGRSEELEPIRAALFAPVEQAETTAMACQMIGRLKDAHSRPMLQRLVEASQESARPSEVRLAALEAMGNIGVDGERLLPQIEPYLRGSTPAVRAQACAALAATGTQAALGPLAAMLDDRDESVRVAAAYAVISLTSGERAWMAAPPAQRY